VGRAGPAIVIASIIRPLLHETLWKVLMRKRDNGCDRRAWLSAPH